MKFIELVKKDLEKLKEALMKNLEEFHFPFDDFEYFTYLTRSLTSELINKTLFNDKEDLIYFERVELFKGQFLALKQEKFEDTNLFWVMVEYYHWFDFESPLKNFYHYLLNKYVDGFDDLTLLLERSKQLFHDFIKNKQLPIEIWVYLDGLSIENSIKIDSEFELVFLENQITAYPEGHSFIPVDFAYLIYQTKN